MPPERRSWMLTNWKEAENLTDYWHLPWVLLSTDKWPDCPLFSTKPVFKALNSIVPLFSSDNVIKCAFLELILAARRLSVIFRGWFYCKTRVCLGDVPSVLKWPMILNLRSSENAPAYDGCSQWGRYKGNWQFLLRLFRDGFSWSSYNLHPNIIPANFFWVKCVRFSPCHDRDFRKRPGDFRRFPTNFRRLPNVAEN